MSTPTYTEPSVSEPDTSVDSPPVRTRHFEESRLPRRDYPASDATRDLSPRPALTTRQRCVYWGLTAVWLAVNVSFWAWWFMPGHSGSTPLFVAATAALAYLVTILPTFYWFFVGRARRPPSPAPPPGLRVAMITLCVPSHESTAIVARQLAAMSRVRYPHDSWVLDEGDDPDVRVLAEAFGVRYFSRRGVERWNRPGPPFQEKTKAGNVNAWLDHVTAEGYEYDAFVQLDIDHLPRRDYLDKTLGHLHDPDVAWVQAPSVVGNLDSWVARGLAEQDVVLQGPLQMGFYGHSQTPFIIGSHTTYRTAAVLEIGGFQPTRAEDHLDTVVLAAHGYRGVYVPDLIARGDGPTDLSTYLGQQFAWAYSMVQIFLNHMPRLVRRYEPRQAFQFLMAQSWYCLWSLSCVVLWVLPVVALLTGHPIADVVLSEFFAAFGLVLLTSTLMWWTSRHLFQPPGITLSWRGPILEIARWPIVFSAVVNVLLRVARPYMITPKGSRVGALPPGRRLYGPFFTLAWVCIGSMAAFVAFGTDLSTAGYLWLVLFNLAAVLVMLSITIALEHHQFRRKVGLSRATHERAGTFTAFTLTVGAAAAVAVAAWPHLMEAVG